METECCLSSMTGIWTLSLYLWLWYAACRQPGVGALNHFPLPCEFFSNFQYHWNTIYMLHITFIFGRCHHSLAVVTPAKYECDSVDLTYIFAIQKYAWQINLNQALVTPTPGLCIPVYILWDRNYDRTRTAPASITWHKRVSGSFRANIIFRGVLCCWLCSHKLT